MESIVNLLEPFHRSRTRLQCAHHHRPLGTPKENDTENYIRTVLLISGLGGMENLPQPSRKVDEERLVRLIGAMTCVECGIRYKEVDWNAIREGYELAFPGKRSYARTKPVPQDSSINLTPDEIEDLLMWDEYRYW